MKGLVALKMIPPGRLKDELLRRFQCEAAMGSLVHPNLVHALDCDHDNKLYFLVMEYVDGVDLMHLVNTHGPLDYTRAANYVAQAAGGLAFAHESGWIHRDVKPSNLLVDRKGRIRITDMGVARLTADDGDELTRQSRTCAASRPCSAASVSCPRTGVRCPRGRCADGRVRAGCNALFLADGQVAAAARNASGEDAAPAATDADGGAPVAPDIPADLDAVLHRLMARRPELRYETPAAAMQALEPPVPGAERAAAATAAVARANPLRHIGAGETGKQTHSSRPTRGGRATRGRSPRKKRRRSHDPAAGSCSPASPPPPSSGSWSTSRHVQRRPTRGLVILILEFGWSEPSASEWPWRALAGVGLGPAFTLLLALTGRRVVGQFNRRGSGGKLFQGRRCQLI